jgi:hypothetical protein
MLVVWLLGVVIGTASETVDLCNDRVSKMFSGVRTLRFVFLQDTCDNPALHTISKAIFQQLTVDVFSGTGDSKTCQGGGAIYYEPIEGDTNMSIDACVFEECSASGPGGALCVIVDAADDSLHSNFSLCRTCFSYCTSGENGHFVYFNNLIVMYVCPRSRPGGTIFRRKTLIMRVIRAVVRSRITTKYAPVLR